MRKENFKSYMIQILKKIIMPTIWCFSVRSVSLALLGFTCLISMGFAFSLEQGSILEGVSLTDDMLGLCSGQGIGCKHSSSLQHYQKMCNKSPLIQ